MTPAIFARCAAAAVRRRRCYTSQTEAHNLRDVVYSRAPPRPPPRAPPRRGDARQARSAKASSDLHSALGAVSGTALVAAVVYTYVDAAVLGISPIAEVERTRALSIASLLRSGWQPLLTSTVLHLDPLELASSVALLLPATAAAALAPTYLHRWCAIPLVFLASAVAGGAAQLRPDVEAALDFASLHPPPPASGTPRYTAAATLDLRSQLHAAWLRLLRDGDVRAAADTVRRVMAATAASLEGNRWVFDDGRFPVVAYGSSTGALGLLTFAACEWGIGARMRIALLAPAAAAAAHWHTLRHPDEAWRLWADRGGGGRRIVGRPVEYNASTGAGAALAGIAAGAACWGAGRGARFALHLVKLPFAARARASAA